MLSFLYVAAEAFASSFLQFIVGFALALFIGRVPASRRVFARLGRAGALEGPPTGRSSRAAILAAAVIGCALPLGPDGAVPIAAAALGAGLGAELAVPFLLSGLVFNLLAPFADPTFIWRTGYVRVIFALVAGCLAGLLVLRRREAASSWFGRRFLPALSPDRPGEGEEGRDCAGPAGASLAGRALASLAFGALFLAAGALADLAFKRYALGAIMGFAYSSPAVSFVPEFFAARNVVNPLFLLAMRIAALLTSFGAYAALALILRPRGFLRYFAYFAAWALLLGLSAFVKT